MNTFQSIGRGLGHIGHMFLMMLNITEHESPRVFIAFSIKLLFQTAYVFVNTFLIATYVAQYTSQSLPSLYLAIGLLTITVTLLVSSFLQDVKPQQMMLTMVALSLVLLFSAIFFPLGSPVFFVLLIALMAIGFAQIHIWLALWIEELFSPLEGERIFPLVESSEPLGGILGALMVLFLTQTSFSLMAVLAAPIVLLLLLIPFLFFRLESHIPLLSEEESEEHPPGLLQTFQGFFYSSFLRGLFLVVFLQFFVFQLVDFYFASMLEASLLSHEASHSDSGPEAFASSIAHQLGYVHLGIFTLLFLTQVTLSSKMLRSVGVLGGMSLAPLFCAATFVANILLPTYPAAIAAKATFEISHGISRNSYVSIFYALHGTVRDSVKEFLDGIAKPLGIIMATALLFLLQSFFSSFVMLEVVLGIMIFASLLSGITLLRMRHLYTQISRLSLENSPQISRRLQAIEILSQKGHENSVGILSSAAKRHREDTEFLCKLLQSLAKTQSSHALPSIIALLDHDSEEVIYEALRALLAYGSFDAASSSRSVSQYTITKKLEFLFSDSSRNLALRREALRALCRVQPQRSVEIMMSALTSGDREQILLSLSVLGDFSDSAVVPYILPLLSSTDPQIQSRSIALLWRFPHIRIQLLPILDDLLQSSSTERLLEGIRLLGELQVDGEVPRLRQLLHHDSQQIQHAASLALASCGHTEAHSPLLHFLFEGDHTLAFQTHHAITRIDHPPTKKILKRHIISEATRRIHSIFRQAQSSRLDSLSRDDLLQIFRMLHYLEAEVELWYVRHLLRMRGGEVHRYYPA